MEYIHQVINSEKLVEIFDLPASLMGRTVEVIILPVPIMAKKSDAKKKSSFGALKEYANPALIHEEDGAWEKAIFEKYANN